MQARVRQEMLALYTASDVPVFLIRFARELLAQGREQFAKRRLAACPLVPPGLLAIHRAALFFDTPRAWQTLCDLLTAVS